MKTDNLSRLTLIVVVLALPMFAFIEHKYGSVWNNRLFIPNIVAEPNFHTPAHTSGTYLPPVINKSVTYTRAQSPLLINNVLTIMPLGSVTIEPGVNVYVGEYGQIVNEGQLTISGSKNMPVTFDTNEANEANQVWGGIISKTGSKTSISFANITQASPAVTCLKNSQTKIEHSKFSLGNLGLYGETNTCNIQDTIITAVRDGIIAVHEKPTIHNVLITANHSQETFIP